MKTLVVLSALAIFALAAPAPPALQDGFENNPSSSSEEKNPELREKKSTSNEFESPDAEFNTLSSNPSISGRTLVIKKPLIVKKKVGYHLYRNSDEEQEHTSSRENCMERVKVKLCKEKTMPKSMMRSSTQQEPDMSEEEMKHSIVMAKEAVEILQRDLKRLEEKSGVNMLSDREADTEIHEDIEIARQALEHVHKSFGNLESMSLHASTTKDSETSHDMHPTAVTNEEERLAQWKEAMSNIQKNMDIAKNIEDSFRFSTTNVFLGDTDMNSATNSEDVEENLNSHFSSVEQEMRMDLNADTNNNQLTKSKGIFENSARKSEDSLEEITKEEIDNDNKNSASTDKESKANNLKTRDCMTNRNEKIDASQNSFKEKSSELTIPDEMRQGQFASMSKDLKTEQTSGFNKESFKASGNMMDSNMGASTNQMTFVKPDSAKQNNSQDEIKQDLSDYDDMQLFKYADNMDQFSRSNGKENTKAIKSDKKITKFSDKFEHGSTNLKTKHAFPSSENIEQIMNTDDVKNENKLEKNQFSENSLRSQNLVFRNKAESTGILPKFSNELKPFPMEGDLTNDAAKEAMDIRWTHNLPLHSGESNKEFFDHRDTQFSNDPQTFPTFLQPGTNMAIAGKMLPSQGSRMSNLMHGQAHERDWEMQPSQKTNMRESSGIKSDNLFRWKSTHESSRSGYGAPLAPASTGAMALYPSANPNGCSIPLLVSCAPSVVSGSLTKGHHHSYGAPAYRTDEEMGFPIKREAKKTNEIIVNDEKELSTNVKQKPIKITEKQ